MEIGIDTAFDLMDRWRHLPKYQLERRADIFFAIYLRKFLQDRRGLKLREQLVPEFPIHLQSLGREGTGHSSCNVDFLALADDMANAFFLELKTDELSLRCEQDDYLLDAQRTGLPLLLKGIVEITAATKKKAKYLHLLCLLEDLGLLSLPMEIRRRHAAANLRGLGADLQNVRIAIGKCPLRIFYLQPKGNGGDRIGFAEFADWLEPLTDPVSKRFRQSLLTWTKSIAGESQTADAFFSFPSDPTKKYPV